MLRVSTALLCAALALGACDSGSTSVEPESSRSTEDPLLAVGDLPDGYVTSPPEPEPEVSGSSSVSVAGCDTLLNHYRDGAGADVRFEAGGTGPFLAEALSADAGTLTALRDLAGRCAAFTDTDAAGETTSVTVTAVELPGLGDESAAIRMAVASGTGDESFTLSGYVIAARVGATTCTLVHFGQPEPAQAETETIARTAVGKLKRRQ